MSWFATTPATLPDGTTTYRLTNAPDDIDFFQVHDGAEYVISGGDSDGDSPSDSYDVIRTIDTLAIFAEPIDTTRCLTLNHDRHAHPTTPWLCQREDHHPGTCTP